MSRVFTNPRWLLPVLLVLTAMVYWAGLAGPFIFDDFTNVLRVRLSSPDWQGWIEAVFGNASGPLRRPVSNLSFVLNALWAGDTLEPFGYKIVNLAVHLVNMTLVFAVAAALFRRLDWARPAPAALLVAALWGLHPLQVSTVLYPTQRMTLLASLFVLVAVRIFLRVHARPCSPRRLAVAGGAIVLSGCLAMLSKEIGALLPVYLLVIVLVVPGPALNARGQLALRGALIWLPVLIGAAVLAARPGLVLNGYELETFGVRERLMTQLDVLFRYLQMIVIPRPALFGLYHDEQPIISAMTAGLWLRLGALLAAGLLALWLRRRAALVSFAVLWFCGGHLLESTVFGLDMMYEHRNYLPMLGPLMLAGALLPGIRRLEIRSVLGAAIPVVLVLGLTMLTALRVNAWKDQVSFFENQLRFHPESPRFWTSFFSYLLVHDPVNAERALDRMLTIDPRDPTVGILRLALRCARDEFVSDLDLRRARLAIGSPRALMPTYFATQQLVEMQREQACRYLAGRDFISLARTALANPAVITRRPLLVRWMFLLGLAEAESGRLPAARNAVGIAVDLAPSNTTYRIALVELAIREQRPDLARRYLENLTELDVAPWLKPQRKIERLQQDLAR